MFLLLDLAAAPIGQRKAFLFGQHNSMLSALAIVADAPHFSLIFIRVNLNSFSIISSPRSGTLKKLVSKAGCSIIFSQALLDAIEAHRQRGMLFITAAGNGNIFGIGQNNDTTPFYPCSYYLPNVICVASTTRTDARSTFSNFGRRTVHVGAPGSEILSSIRGNSYASLSGTSMATPHVTGVAALLQAHDPSLDWRGIKNLILAGGDNVTSLTNIRLRKNASMLSAR